MNGVNQFFSKPYLQVKAIMFSSQLYEKQNIQFNGTNISMKLSFLWVPLFVNGTAMQECALIMFKRTAHL